MGKTALVMPGSQALATVFDLRRYLKNTFDDKVETTIGMDFQTKTVQLLNGSQIRLQLWDTAGQERFRSLVSGYIRDAAAAIVWPGPWRSKCFTGSVTTSPTASLSTVQSNGSRTWVTNHPGP